MAARLAGVALTVLPPPTATLGPQLANDWPTFDYTAARSGFVAGDTSLTTHNVGALRRAWIATYDDTADSTPILLAHVRMPRGGTRALLVQTTKSGTTYAVDARSGAIVWRFATHGPGITTPTAVAGDPHAR